MKNDGIFHAKRAVLPSGLKENVLMRIVDGLIVEVSAGVNPEGLGSNLIKSDVIVPGFIDIHTHGIGGDYELLEYWNHPEYTCSRVLQFGTTSLLASITFSKEDPENLNRILSSLTPRIGIINENCAVIEGIHAEGPIVADLGGLVPGDNEMNLEDFTLLLDKIGSSLKVMTISPSIDSKLEFARMKLLKSRGIAISIGHDKGATEKEILDSLRLGSEENPIHVTHIFNVQQFHHRDMGIANVCLLSKFPKSPEYEGILDSTVEIVGDLLHVHPLVVQMLLKVKDWNNIVFITDAVLEPEAGKSSSYGGRQLEVSETKIGCCPRVVLKGTNTIAGSCTTMLSMFQNLVKLFEVPLEKASAMCSTNPARVAKLKGIGSIQVGNRADLVLLSDDLEIQQTIIAGKVVWSKS